MTVWIAILYGIIQGATEFLPVSSSGHLVLLNLVFNTDGNLIFFSLLLHLATLFAVLVVLRKQVIFIVKNPFCDLAKKLYIATIPTVIIALLFMDFFTNSFSGAFLPICFMITAVFLFFVEMYGREKAFKSINKSTAFIMGLAQGVAILPGISRSGATIITGLFCKGSRKEISEFSFLMSIPIILASMAYEIFSCVYNGTPIFDTPLVPTFFAFASAFLVGIFCVKFMINMLQKIKLYYFSIYLILISIFSLFLL